MKTAELKSKSREELTDMLHTSQLELAKFRGEVHMKHLKNIRQIRSTRKTIAQLFTMLNGSTSK